MTLIRMILQQVIFIALSSRVNVTGWHRQLSLTFIAYNTNIMASFVIVGASCTNYPVSVMLGSTGEVEAKPDRSVDLLECQAIAHFPILWNRELLPLCQATRLQVLNWIILEQFSLTSFIIGTVLLWEQISPPCASYLWLNPPTLPRLTLVPHSQTLLTVI